MNADLVVKVETGLDACAAALFGSAVAYALSQAAPGSLISAAAIGALAFGLCFALLRRVPVEEPVFALPDLSLAQVPVEEMADVELDDAQPEGADELLLDDALTEPDPQSRVVRLFDPSAMPQVEGSGRRTRAATVHDVRDAYGPTAPPDASQALHEALAELRRSLTTR